MRLPVVSIVLVVGLMCYALFTVSAATGAVAATNETVSIHEERETLTESLEEVKKNSTREYSGWYGEAVKPVISTTIDAAILSAEYGIDTGYKHPTAATAHAQVSPVVMMGFLLGLIYRVWSKGRG